MAKHFLEQVVGRTISSPQNTIMAVRVPFSGTLDLVTVYLKNNAGATLKFDVNKGTTLSTAASVFADQNHRPTITSGNYSANNGGTLALAVNAGDLLTVDADDVPESFELATVIFRIDDGVAVNNFSYFEKDAPYSTPDAKDDEFAENSLNARWTRDTGGQTAVMEFNKPYSHLKISGGNVSNLHYYYQTAPSGNFKARMKVFAYRQNSGTSAAGIAFSVGTAALHGAMFSMTASAQVRAQSYTSITSTAPTNNALLTMSEGSVIWLELERTSTQMWARCSVDGIIFGEGHNFGNFTPTTIGFWGFGMSPRFCLIDWFRIVQGDFTGRQITL